MDARRIVVGAFDSGVGGISVLREIHARLPDADFIYVADSRHVPYGEKPPAFIAARSLALTQFLVEQRADAVVVACNTATAAAVQELRARFALPIVAMEPAVKPALAATRRGVVGVLATTGTLASARFAALLDRYRGDKTVLTEPCPGWVAAVERGELHGPATRELVARHVQPLLAQGADVLILGCTHYPLHRPVIEQVAGPGVAIVDTGAAVARRVEQVLAAAGLACGVRGPSSVAFHTSGDVALADPVIGRLWPGARAVNALPERFR